MADIPEPLAYGTVTGHFMSILADSSDDGTRPDILPLSGKVTVTPTVKQFRVKASDGTNYIVVSQAIQAQIVDGVLLGPDGVSPLELLASDSPGINPSPIQYTAKFAIAATTTQPADVVFDVPANGTVDISAVVPTPPTVPVQSVVVDKATVLAEAATYSDSKFDIASPIIDLNTAPIGWAIAQSGAANRPTDAGSDSVIVQTLEYLGWDSEYRFQTATSETTGKVWARFFYATWSTWQTTSGTNTSGAGIPADMATTEYVDSKTLIPTSLGTDGPQWDTNSWLNMTNRGIYNSGGVFNLPDPTSGDQAVPKRYVDSRFVTITQAAYDALATKDPTVLYLITG